MYDTQRNTPNTDHAFVQHLIYTTECIWWLFTLATYTAHSITTVIHVTAS